MRGAVINNPAGRLAAGPGRRFRLPTGAMAAPSRSARCRVVVVTGKGGVGKTTICAALGVAAAGAGLRTLLCETSGADSVCGRFGVPFEPYTVTPVLPNLHTLSIQSEAAIEEYLLRMLRFRRVYEMVFKNRVMGPFLDAVPGLHDLIQLGKVFDLEREHAGFGRSVPAWDLILVDAPATGHGLGMLTAPRGMMRLTRSGPLHDNARDVAALIEDPVRTRIVLVSLAEDLPVQETVELYGRLAGLQTQVGAVVLNGVQPCPVPPAYAGLRDSLEAQADAAGREALTFADAAVARAALQDHARGVLAGLGPAVVDLPDVPRQDPAALAALGLPLARALGLVDA